MLIFNITPICLNCGVILNKSDILLKEIENYKEKFKYILPEIKIDFKNKILLFFKLNYFKIEDFKISSDYEFLKNKLNINNNCVLDENDKKMLESNQNNNIILACSSIKNTQIENCYYCGELTAKKEFIIFEIFQKKCIKIEISIIELNIKGIDFITNNLDNSFFNLNKRSVSNVISVGEGIEKETQKNYKNLKNNLYPFLLATGQEGICVYRIDSINSFKKLGGNSFGPTTLWSILTYSCGYEDQDAVINEIVKGDNRLIDLSVGDIYGGNYENMSLSSNLIGSSFCKFKDIEDVNKLEKKDIAKSLAILYGATYSHVTSLVSHKENINKLIISGNTFYSLELFQIIQTSVGRYSNNTIETYFSDYLDFFEIIGLYIELENNNSSKFL